MRIRLGPLQILAATIALACVSRAHAASNARLKTPSGKTALISADEFYRDADAALMELKGNVQVVYGDEHLSCDRAIVHLDTQEIEADGHILVISPTARVSGDRATMNYQLETGTIYNGFVESQQVSIEGEIVRKTGPKTYEAEKAHFTACSTCPPAWSFSGSKIEAELGGYARIKNPLFKIAYFPIPIWFPYMIMPLKSERQSGFLAPAIGFEGPGGTSLSERYFWAISQSQDAMIAAKSYQWRGPKLTGNYRYVLSEESEGEGTVAAIQDQVFVGDSGFKNYSNGIGSFTRYLVDYGHKISLPDGFSHRLKLNLISDLYYVRDFPEEMPGYGAPSLESRASLTRNGESTHASIDASYYINQLERNPVSSNADAVHRIPELRFSVTSQRIADTDFLFKMDMNYANFTRNSPSYDHVVDLSNPGRVLTPNDLSLDEQHRLLPGGVIPGRFVDNSRNAGAQAFNPARDLIRAGQRLDIRPEISSPFHLGRYLDVLPSLSFRHTQYGFSATGDSATLDSSPAREYVQGDISMRTRFSRVFGEGMSSSGVDLPSVNGRETRYKHEIEPELAFTTLPWFQQPTIPFFGAASPPPPFLADQPISDADFYSTRGVQFDYHDRVYNRNVATVGLSNKLIRKTWRGDDAEYKQIGNLRLTQSYDLDQARRSGGYPLSDFAALLDVRLERFETNTVVRYFPNHGYTNTSSRMKVMDSRGDFLQLSYTQLFLISENFGEAFQKRTENIGFSAGFKSKHADFLGGIDYLPADGRLNVQGWNSVITLKPPGDCWGIILLFRQAINVGSTFDVAFDYKFGG